MRAWRVTDPGPIRSGPMSFDEVAEPVPGDGEIVVRVRTCGVCRTDLHVAEGDLPVRRPHLVPGHEVVGEVAAAGPGAERFSPGTRIGIPWLRSTCGTCRFCARGDENLCVDPTFTGWTHDGGYAEALVAPEAWAYEVPDTIDDLHLAPLLCAGIIGYRALKRAEVPEGGRLGIWGFGGSAHITAQVAMSRGVEVHVVTRGEPGRRLATELGATWVGEAGEAPPVPLDSAILFAPAGELVPPALEALDRGGTLAIAGIHLSDIPALDHQRHLFGERQVRSVTANTRADGRELLELAADIDLHLDVHPYPFEEADRALIDLAEDRFAGAAVLTVAD